MRRIPRWLLYSGLIVLGVGLFAWLIHLSDPALLLAELRVVGVAGVLVAMGMVLVTILSWMTSWYILLRAMGVIIPWPRIAGPFLAGYAVTYITPSMYIGGEPVRAFLASREAGAPMTTVVATLVVERLLAGFSFLVFASVGGFFALASYQISTAVKAFLGFGLAVVAAFLVLVLISFAGDHRWFSQLIARLGRAFPRRGILLRAAVKVAETERTAFFAFTKHLPSALIALAFQFLTAFLEYIRPQVFFFFTQRQPFPVSQLSIYYILNAFLSAFLWITPGGLGVAEGGRMGIFSLLGVGPSEAMAFLVVFRLFELLAVAFGVYYLIRHGVVRLRRGRVEVQMDEPPSSPYNPPSGGG